MINLKVSEKEKYKDENQWFKDFMDHIVPYGGNDIPDYNKMSACYRAVNMDLSDFKELTKSFCSPLGDLADTVVDELIAYPELRNKISVLKGELIKRNDQMRLQLESTYAKKLKTEELYSKLAESVDERAGIELRGFAEQMKGMPEEQAQQFVAQLRSKHEPEDLLNKEWLSELEIFYNKALRFCYQDQQIKFLQADTIEDAAIADRCFIYNGWRNGKPFIEIRNPKHLGFHKNPNEPFVHKGDWIWYRKTVTLSDAMANYNLTDDQIESLGGTTGSSNYKKYSAIHGSALAELDHSMRPVYEAIANENSNYNKEDGLNQNDHTMSGKHHLIYETHLEVKAYKKIIFLSYNDEYGKQCVETLSSDYEIPKKAKKEKYDNRFDEETERWVWFDKDLNVEYQAEEVWIPRAYEIVRLGSDVYPVVREVPYQEVNIEDPFSSFELNTKGCIFNARNAESVSLVAQAMPSYLQYCYIKAVQNRELAKYQGFIHSVDIDQIPDELGSDADGKNVDRKQAVSRYFALLRKTNRDIYSGSQSTLGGLPPSTRSPGSGGFNLGTAGELLNLQNLSELTSRNISMAMGISPQREANYTQGTNVSDNQQAVINSYTITEPLFFRHATIWKDVLSTWLKQFRKYCQIQMEVHNLKDLSFEIWLPDGTSELLSVTPKHLEHADIGLYLVTNAANDKYAEMMMQLTQPFAQNQGQGVVVISQIIKDIVSGASSEEIHKRIAIEATKQQEQTRALQQQQTDAEGQQLAMRTQHEQQMQKFELELIREKAGLDYTMRTDVAKIQALGFAQNQDVDSDGIPDVLEIEDLAIKKQKLALDTQKQNDTVRLKEEELKLKAKALSQKPSK